MAKNGGYRILDIKGFPVKVSTATKQVIPGIYEFLEATTKPILLSGLSVIVTTANTDTETEYKDTFIEAHVSSNNFVFTAFGINFTVTDDDEIYFTAAEDVAAKKK